jgi:hypothetical protein
MYVAYCGRETVPVYRLNVEGKHAVEPHGPPYYPPLVRADASKPNPKMGINQLLWSPCGLHLAVSNPSFPSCFFVFRFPPSELGLPSIPVRPRLVSVVSVEGEVGRMSWNPDASKELLAVGYGRGAIALWACSDDDEEEEGESEPKVEGVGIPSRESFFRRVSAQDNFEMCPLTRIFVSKKGIEFSCKSVKWSGDGRKLICCDRETFCLAFPVEEGDESRVIFEEEDE